MTKKRSAVKLTELEQRVYEAVPVDGILAASIDTRRDGVEDTKAGRGPGGVVRRLVVYWPPRQKTKGGPIIREVKRR